MVGALYLSQLLNNIESILFLDVTDNFISIISFTLLLLIYISLNNIIYIYIWIEFNGGEHLLECQQNRRTLEIKLNRQVNLHFKLYYGKYNYIF